jgi:hypothetical protein
MTFHPMVFENTGETARDVSDIATIVPSEELSASIPTLYLDLFNRSILPIISGKSTKQLFFPIPEKRSTLPLKQPYR